MRSRICLIALTVTMLLTAGCNQSKKKVIAVIPKGTSHLFWVSVQAGALSAGKEFNVDIEWFRCPPKSHSKSE